MTAHQSSRQGGARQDDSNPQLSPTFIMMMMMTKTMIMAHLISYIWSHLDSFGVIWNEASDQISKAKLPSLNIFPQFASLPPLNFQTHPYSRIQMFRCLNVQLFKCPIQIFYISQWVSIQLLEYKMW